MRLYGVCVLALLIACGGEDSQEPPIVGSGGGPTTGCLPGELTLEDGSCRPPGMTPEDCVEGFAHDGAQSCEPILPADPCPPGTMAVPGDTSCHEVSPCAEGAWGDAPQEPSTMYVDAAYAGMDSDGSPQRPWRTIQEGINAADSGAVVAIAEGVYAEDVVLIERVRLWGRCPARVALEGVGPNAALMIAGSAYGSVVHGLAITGASPRGIFAYNTADVSLQGVWIHDVVGRGLELQNEVPNGPLTIEDLLVEGTHEVGVLIAGSEVDMRRIVVRDTQYGAGGIYGRGVDALLHPGGLTPSKITLSRAVIERNRDTGLDVSGSELKAEAIVVRETRSAYDGSHGFGLILRGSPDIDVPSTVALNGGMFEHNVNSSISVQHSVLAADALVVRRNEPDHLGEFGRGVSAQADPTSSAPCNLVVKHSLIAENRDAGMPVAGCHAEVEATVIRDTTPGADAAHGFGLSIREYPGGPRGELIARGIVIERSVGVGLFVSGADATVESVLVRDVAPSTRDPIPGRGINVQWSLESGSDSSLVLQGAQIEGTHDFGLLVIGATATVDSAVIRGAAARPDGLFGDGLAAWSHNRAAELHASGIVVENSVRAGVVSFGALLELSASRLHCNQFDLTRQNLDGFTANLVDAGDNLCGCGSEAACKLIEGDLQPPSALTP